MIAPRWLFALGLLLMPQVGAVVAADPELDAHLVAIRSVGPKGAGHTEAVKAVQAASKAKAAQLTQILAAMDGANPIASNWLRGVAESVAQQARAKNALPVQELEAFLADTRHSPRGRRLAYELVAAVDPSAESRLIPTLLNDASLELRRDAVALALADAAKADGKDAQLRAYQVAFRASRDHDQIKLAADKIKELGGSVDLPLHYGFITTWWIVGPFDNLGDRGWDVVYPPEEGVELKARYAGQKGEIGWIEATTADELGMVDLNKILDKHKGAIAYAYAEFISDKEHKVELRLGCINANKVFLNGELITANHVYHANTAIDQYVARGTLKPGKNAILLKIAQNEQTEVWAQEWRFQLRVCDAIGTAILSRDRAAAKSASLVRPLK
jgi:hypothetical protein